MTWWRGRRDLRRAVATTAGQLMSKPAVTVSENTTVAGAARLMSEHNVKRLPVHDGEVTLTGQLDLKSQLSLVEDLTHHIDGVVDVTADLTYRLDDTHGHLPEAMTVDITHEPWLR